MAASIASGTLGSGAADLVGMGAEIGKGAALAAATVAVAAATGGTGPLPAEQWRQRKQRVRWEVQRQPRALPPPPVAWVRPLRRRQYASAAGFWRGRGWLSQLSSRSSAANSSQRTAGCSRPAACAPVFGQSLSILGATRNQHQRPARWQRPCAIGATANRKGGINSARDSDTPNALCPCPPGVG